MKRLLFAALLLLGAGGIGYGLWQLGRSRPDLPSTAPSSWQNSGNVDRPSVVLPSVAPIPATTAEADRLSGSVTPGGAAPAPGTAGSIAQEAEAVREVALAKIQELTVTYDAKSLPALAVYLRDADVEVREAARDGVVQLGEAAGARFLREAADQTKNPAEALAMLDAADFLELPSVNTVTPEFIARTKAERAKINKKAPAP